MISKMLALSVETLINLNLIKGYKLLSVTTVERLETNVRKTETKLLELTEKGQNQEKDSNTDKTKITGYIQHKEKLNEELTKTFKSYNDESIAKAAIQRLLEEAESELELARADVLIHREKIDEAEQLSKQLKEALERWTSL